MAHLKLKDWQSAESDATSAIKLDRNHVKSYRRRSIARSALGKARASLKDLYLAQEIIKAVYTTDDQKAQNQNGGIKISQAEAELRRIIHNAPKRKVDIQSQTLETKSDGYDDGDYETIASPIVSTTSSANFYSDVTREPLTSLQTAKSWIQFERVWKYLEASQKVPYLAKIKPSKLTEMYKHGFEDANLFLDLMVCCSKMNGDGVRYMGAISKIPSIDMVAMMLSNEEKALAATYIDATLKGHEGDTAIRSNFGL